MTTAKKKIGNTGSAAKAISAATVGAAVSGTPAQALAQAALKAVHAAED